MIKQLVELLPNIKLNKRLIWAEFEDEIKRFTHLNELVNKNKVQKIELTPHNTEDIRKIEQLLDEEQMIRDYLLHILQYGIPAERLKILSGIETRFELKDRRLIIR